MRRWAVRFTLAVLAPALPAWTASGRLPAQAAPQGGAAASRAADAVQHWLPTQTADDAAAHTLQSPPVVRYFTLEHRSPDQMDLQDRELIRSRRQELAAAAAVFGYDLSRTGWNFNQAMCPALPDDLLLHYRTLRPNGSQSLFTALVPRGAGRVRVIPSLHENASTFLPAVKDPRNYALFRELIPAHPGATIESDWLPLAMCYAEMVGSQPNVPDDPSIDLAMVHAPAATLRIDEQAKTTQVLFPDREGVDAYVVWTISFDKLGRILSAAAEDHATFVAHVVTLPESIGKTRANPLEPGGKVTTPVEQPRTIFTNPPLIIDSETTRRAPALQPR